MLRSPSLRGALASVFTLHAARAMPQSAATIIAARGTFAAPMSAPRVWQQRNLALRGGAEAKAGDAVPEVVFKARVRDDSIGGDNPFTWKDVSTSDLFKGKRVVVFSLPGAFTPTCSSTHLPGYESDYEVPSLSPQLPIFVSLLPFPLLSFPPPPKPPSLSSLPLSFL